MAIDPGAPDLILHSGLFTTLDRSNPTASAVAVKNGVFTVVGHTEEIMPLAGPSTRSVDLRGRRVLPGLIDNHLHMIRGGLSYNMELRWDGVRSLADAMAMLKRQVAVTPPPQWVRVVGGFTEHQFAEKRLPTIDELNAAAPDTPVFLCISTTARFSTPPRYASSDTPRTRRSRRPARSFAMARAIRPGCWWPSRMPAFSTRRSPRPETAGRLSDQLDAPFHA